MKRFLLIPVLALGLTLPTGLLAQAAAVIAKQRAKELRDQNNVRQGVPTPAASPSAAPNAGGNPAAPGATSKPLESALKRLVGQANPPSGAKEAVLQQLLAAARGPQKPGRAALQGFVDSLAACLSTATLEDTEVQRLATDLFALMNSATLSAERLQQVLADVQAILQVGGVRRAQAVSVTGQLRQIAQSLQQPATP